MLNLRDAVKLYNILQPYLFDPPEDMSPELYVIVLMTLMHNSKDDRNVFEILALGTEFDAEYYAQIPPEQVIDKIVNKLSDNSILTLKKFMEELANESRAII